MGESRALILRLALRAIRWRAAASATIFAVAVVAIVAATVGPIYLHAVDQVVLTRHLRDASPSQRDVMVARDTALGYPGVDWEAQVRSLAAGFTRDHLFARPQLEEQVKVDYDGLNPQQSVIAALGDFCAHLEIVRGRCVAGNSTDETVISTHTAAAEHLGLGGTLEAATTTGDQLQLRVVGIYRPRAPDGAFWAPWSPFQFGQINRTNAPPPGDASFVTAAALRSRASQAPELLSANVALLPGAVSYDDIGDLRATLANVEATLARLTVRASERDTTVATVTTSLADLLDATAHETSLARTLVTIATAQLALLAIFLLYAVVANTITAQGPEVALAKLRGRRPASILLQSVAQPVVLVLAAAPVAALLAWLLVRLFAASLLGHPVSVTFPPAAYGVAALALLGGVLAALVAAYRIVVTPVGALMRLGGAEPGSPVGLIVADAAAVTIAVAGLVELEAGGVLNADKPNPLSVLAPTLLAVALAVVVLRLLPLLGRRLARWTRDSQKLATFLAVRQLLRRPAEARAVLLVAVAVSIAAFAVTLWSDSRHNRSLRALNVTGASTVLRVRPGAGVHDLRMAVDRADPSGNSMAVAYTNTDHLPPLIAVDTRRFATVGAWVRGNARMPLPAVLRRLGAGVASVTVAGAELRLNVDLTKHPTAPVQLALVLTEPDGHQVGRRAGVIAPGAGSYTIDLPASCAGGCRIATLALATSAPGDTTTTQAPEIDATIGASLRSRRGGGWQPLPAFADYRRWRGDGNGPVTVATTGGSLSLKIKQMPLSAWPAVISAAITTSVPAVIGSVQAGAEEGTEIESVETVGLDRQALLVDGVVRSVTLPAVGRGGVMVDFGTALGAMRHPSAKSTHYEVWLSPHAPPNMAARLARQHVYVTHTAHAATVQATLDDSGPAYADKLLLFSALAATILAIAATAVGRVLSIRRRSYELAALEAVGVAPRTLRRATAAEQGSVFAIGLIVGLVAGLVGSHLALPSTPVFVDTTTGPPLVLGLPWALLAALTAGVIAVFIAVSVAIARAVERVASPAQLRGAQQ